MQEFNTPQAIIDQINDYAERYGKEILQYPVYLEQCSVDDAEYKRTKQKWDIIKVTDESAKIYPDYPEDEYFHMLGGVGINTNEKYLTINVNF